MGFDRRFAFCVALWATCAGCSFHHKPAATRPAATMPALSQRQPMPLDDAMHLIDHRAAWTDLPPIDVPRNPAEKHLKDLTIVIDPGHGGADGGSGSTRPAGYKAGRAGEKEAYMNIRVGLLLERLLKDAGADVVMTRHGDDTIGLRERAEVANNVKRKRDGGVGADLFVSIHHNAGGGRGTNYTSVWYHGAVDDNEPDMDVARYLDLELSKAMRTQIARGAPIYSSQLMYDSGFGVLRACHVPAVLCECSFFSDPDEEQRLRDAGYNLREAYAIYTGLCEWAYCGRPTQTTPSVSGSGSELVLTTTLDEGIPNWWGSDRNRIVASTVQVTVDGQAVPISFDELTRNLTAKLPSSAGNGEHVITIHHANLLKNHNWPQRYQLSQSSAGAAVTALPALRPSRQPPRRATTRAS